MLNPILFGEVSRDEILKKFANLVKWYTTLSICKRYNIINRSSTDEQRSRRPKVSIHAINTYWRSLFSSSALFLTLFLLRCLLFLLLLLGPLAYFFQPPIFLLSMYLLFRFVVDANVSRRNRRGEGKARRRRRNRLFGRFLRWLRRRIRRVRRTKAFFLSRYFLVDVLLLRG